MATEFRSVKRRREKVTEFRSVEMRQRIEKIREIRLSNSNLVFRNLRLEFRTYDPCPDYEIQGYEYTPGIYITGEYEKDDGDVVEFREYVFLDSYEDCINKKGHKIVNIEGLELNIMWKPKSLIKESQIKPLNIAKEFINLGKETQPEEKVVMTPDEHNKYFVPYMKKKYGWKLPKTNEEVVPIREW